MKKSIITALFTLCLLTYTSSVFSQTIVVPDTLDGWAQTWVANFNGSQASFNNWSEGGVNTLSGAASTMFTRYHRKGQFSYGFRTNLRYGQSKLNGNEVRKSDDLISIRNRATYDLTEGSKFAAYAAVQFKTQFGDGYDYGKKVNGGDSLISAFMAPAYLTEGIGIEVNASPNLKIEAGLAMKQTFLRDSDLAPNYGMAVGETFRSEGGIGTGITYQNQVMENIMFSSSIETFTNLLITLDKTDVFWSNELTGRINRLISASFQFELRYDDDFSREIQLKQVLSAGITVSLY
ncbi:MAG: DUF3078 domain-containing protein [Balneolaceae bacterium]